MVPKIIKTEKDYKMKAAVSAKQGRDRSPNGPQSNKGGAFGESALPGDL